MACANGAYRTNDIARFRILETVNSNSQHLIRGQEQLRVDTLGLMRSGVNLSQQILRGHEQLRGDTLQGQAQLRAEISNLIHATPSQNQYPPVSTHEGSSDDAAAILFLLRRIIPSALTNASLPATSMGDFRWMEKGVCDISSGVHILAASEVREGLNLVPYGYRRVTQPIGLQALHFLNLQSSSVMLRKSSRTRQKEIQVKEKGETDIFISLEEGNLSIQITDECQVSSGDFSTSLRGFRVMFAPNLSHGLPGMSAVFVESFAQDIEIPSAIRTFGIVPRECKIIDHIRHGNFQEVRAILQRQECSARDRDEYGNSLLRVSIHQRVNISSNNNC